MRQLREISLFSPQMLEHRHHRALLLQFLLSELLSAHEAFLHGQSIEIIISAHPRFFPYDWAKTTGFLNKMKEHSLHLRKSFPDYSKPVVHFEHLLRKTVTLWEKKKKIGEKSFLTSLQKIYSALEPLVEICKDNENMLFFLLKRRSGIDLLMQPGYLRTFLLKLHTSGLETLGEKMCDQYHERGFVSQIPEIKLLMSDLIHG